MIAFYTPSKTISNRELEARYAGLRSMEELNIVLLEGNSYWIGDIGSAFVLHTMPKNKMGRGIFKLGGIFGEVKVLCLEDNLERTKNVVESALALKLRRVR